ncbi:MAG TPA: hypothetical protein VNT60_03575 [Deinococcales bacterium]|nr:hypothetical protein [Deinococcales bacterium]
MKNTFLKAAFVSAILAAGTALATPSSITIKNATSGSVIAYSKVSGASKQVTIQVPRVTADTQVRLVIRNAASGDEWTMDATIRADGSITTWFQEREMTLQQYLAMEGLKLHLTTVNGQGFAGRTEGSTQTGGSAGSEVRGQGEVRSDAKGDNRSEAGAKGDLKADVKADAKGGKDDKGSSAGAGAGVNLGINVTLPGLGGKK